MDTKIYRLIRVTLHRLDMIQIESINQSYVHTPSYTCEFEVNTATGN